MNVREMLERVRGLLGRDEMERTLAEEIAYHVELETAENERRGLAADAARRAALQRFGSIERFKEETREEQRSRWLEDLGRDVRHGLRMIARSPGFSAIAVLSLALGIGANAAIFSVVDAVLLKDLPYPDADRVVRVFVHADGDERGSTLSAADLVAVEEARSFAALGVSYRLPGGVAFRGTDGPITLPATAVTSGVFGALGVAPLLGRLPTKADDQPGSPNTVVLSYGAWRQWFASDPAVVGRTINLAGDANTVLAVMPEGFRLPRLPLNDVWPVLQLERPNFRAPFYLSAIGRMREGATASAVDADLARATTVVKETYPASTQKWQFTHVPLQEVMVRDARQMLLVLFGAVTVVLIIAASNVANLLLARMTGRMKEVAIRTALGAGRARVARQFLTETVLLAMLGAAVGLVIALALVRAIPLFAPDNVARLDEVRLDGRVLLFTTAVALLTGLLVGMAPALRLPRAGLAARMNEGARGGTDGEAKGRLRGALVVVEFALALTMLIGAGLVVNSLLRLQAVESGIRVERVLTASVNLPRTRYPGDPEIRAFYDALLDRVHALPGVLSASASMGLPPAGLVMTNPFTTQGRTYAPGEDPPLAEELLVTPGFFETFGIRLVSGRTFDRNDGAGAPPVMLVNQTMVRQHFGGRDPIGRTIALGQPSPDADQVTIVGVVEDVKYAGLDQPQEPTMYLPHAQNLWWRGMSLAVRTNGDPNALLPALRSEVAALDPEMPLRDVATLEHLISGSVAAPRFRSTLLGGFAVLALLLACAGIYGVMSYSVGQRKREIGIRMALGAQRTDVLNGILGAGAKLTALGIGLGLLGAFAATRLLGSLLFGVQPTDPATFATMTAVLGLVGLGACAIPAWRATRVDPLSSLRGD